MGIIYIGDEIQLKKPYSLDYSIERDVDRVAAIYDILDKLDKNPPPSDLEQMASYILYGKDENGLNAVQRGEISNSNTRFNSFKTKEDKAVSLNAILENPLADQSELKPAHSRDPYTHKLTQIRKPKYDKKTGELIDVGDSDIPGMVELWQSIDRMEHWIAQLEGKIAPDEDTVLTLDSYRLYQLKHTLIDMRRHQYYLKDAYKPTLHFVAADHPKAQFVDWCADSFYWIPMEEWERRTAAALLRSTSKNIEDYEVRENLQTGQKEVKWIVRRHTFDWENPSHIKAFLNNYELLKNQLSEKLNTDGWTLLFDFERYRKMANFNKVREFLIDCKIEHVPYNEILQQLRAQFNLNYNENHLCTIFAREIPQQIADAAKRHRLMIETPDSQCKTCSVCGRRIPKNSFFFTRNRFHKDGFSSACKQCEKARRIRKGEQTEYDRRRKESQVFEMQTTKTRA